jgi:hypothetical protein
LEKRPPEKKEKLNASDTCYVGTDPPEPLDYDPLNVHGNQIREEFREFPTKAKKIIEKLQQQNTSGAAKEIRDKVIKELKQLL